MSWKRPEEAATHYAVSPRTIRARVASGELPSYLEGEEPATRRWVWCAPAVDLAAELRAVGAELAALRAELAELRVRAPEAARDPESRPAPKTRRAASPATPRTKAAPTPSTPQASATSGEAAELVERLIASHGGRVDRAAAALGANRVTVSRWRTGKRTPAPESVEAIKALLVELEPRAEAA